MSLPHESPFPLGKLGVEIELIAPRGRSRYDLAEAIAKHCGGVVKRFFHPQGEPSKAVNTPFFENLTLGFIVKDRQGNVIAQCVDDLTLQDDLNRRHPPQPGWYRIVSNDARLLRLTMRHADAKEPLPSVLEPMARLFGTALDVGEGGMIRVSDETGAPIAIGAPLPGERERPCELITPPIESDHFERIETLLCLARELDFSIPAEGAIHLHFDGGPLCSASTLANLVRFLGTHAAALKVKLETNPRCRRLGGWPPELLSLVNSPGFITLDWEEARQQLGKIKLTKYCDFNIRNLVHAPAHKHTFEVRILPVWLDTQKIIDAAEIFTKIMRWAEADGQRKPVPRDLERFLTGGGVSPRAYSG